MKLARSFVGNEKVKIKKIKKVRKILNKYHDLFYAIFEHRFASPRVYSSHEEEQRIRNVRISINRCIFLSGEKYYNFKYKDDFNKIFD